MSEIERGLGTGFNPYDQLIKPAAEPVRSPVILGNASEPVKPDMTDKTMEIIPLAGAATYSKMTVRKDEIIDIVHMETEDDLLVPDTFPDMKMILNMEACAKTVGIYNDNGSVKIKGKIKLETMYRSDETYGNNICVIPADVTFERLIDTDVDIKLNVKIKRTEHRIINERKYKAKIYIEICLKKENEMEHMIFEEIDGEKLYFHREPVKIMDVISRKTARSEIKEELLLNDAQIRPVKILKSNITVADNHRQITKEKLILNQTLWVRIMYLAEITSKGNLYNQPMLFQGKIDHTQFISLSGSEGEVVSCTTSTAMENIEVKINRESNGFAIDGDVVTEVDFFSEVNRDVVTDFYHEKEEMSFDRRPERVCVSVTGVTAEQTLREEISLQGEVAEEWRIIYLDGYVVEENVSVEGTSVTVSGKVHLEAVVMNEGDYTIIAKKICDFNSSKEFVAEGNCRAELCRAFVREISGDISGGEINLTAQVQVNLNIYNEAELMHINNPCIIRSGIPAKYYPITVHIVVEGESIWDIGKKYKVSEEQVIHYNKAESIKPGNKIIIVK